MAFIVTPGQLSRQAELYHQLGALLSAGMTLIQALEQLRNSPPSRAQTRPLQSLINDLQQGMTFGEAVARLPGWLPSFDVALLAAGEQSGRLDASFRLLAGYYGDRARLARQVISDLAYPVFLVHFAILLAGLPQLVISGGVGRYLQGVLGPLLPAWLLVLFFLLACQGRRGLFWRTLVERVLGAVPVLGKARRHLALARLAVALEALMNAGVSVLQAWPLATAASGSPALQKVVQRWPSHLQAGETPGDLMKQSPEFPEMFANLYATGERGGSIDATLKRLQLYYQDEGTRKLQALAQWIPRAIYLVIVVVLGYQIVNFWTGYFGGVPDRVDDFMSQ